MESRHVTLRHWIESNFDPSARLHINQYLPDFMIRRLFEESHGGFTVSKDEFAAIMLDIGFCGRQTRNFDWVFNISDAEYKKVLRGLR
ncbi:hypothetical protein [Paenibacillus lautus]|uniref:hypothetical protein n=1 Tax=Paenibacillus lautus TaxID=1401 RepID=UPI001C7CEF31|nr:hypothetical protein [Paenibacillus lautus]MBX4145948.1 hypothetical protein [Paenibacillus lautus]